MYQRKGYGLRSDGHIFLLVTDTAIVWKVFKNSPGPSSIENDVHDIEKLLLKTQVEQVLA